MRPLSASELLAVWERGSGQSPVQQALTLLAAACPETPLDALAQWSIGQRDARLLALREWAFGPQLVGLATCPGCNGAVELTLNVADILMEPTGEPAEALSLKARDSEVRFRLPNSLDLAAIDGCEEAATARHLLLERCLLAVGDSGGERPPEPLPADIVEAIAERMARADPQADVQLALACPACGRQWQAAFDIVSFFWSEIDAWARRILRDVHILASAHGWREADILAMSPWRRQAYLDMVST